MATTIRSNGSKWAAESPDSLDVLFQRLADHPLDRTFEAFGNFIVEPVNERGDRLAPEGSKRFWGNFLTYSHVFSIDTDEPELIERLTAAIRTNQQRPDYLSQAPYFDRRKLEIVRHRFSETQGEVTLIYDGRTLGRFGDQITLNGRGQWQGLPDGKWEVAASAHSIIRVAWFNSATGEGGEFLTRSEEEAAAYEAAKRELGCTVNRGPYRP